MKKTNGYVYYKYTQSLPPPPLPLLTFHSIIFCDSSRLVTCIKEKEVDFMPNKSAKLLKNL